MTSTWFSAPAPVTRRVRAYFAPVNRAAQTPVLFDPSQQGRFSLDAPPAPWISLGWIQDFARKPASKSTPLLTGIPAAPLEQVRETLQAQVSLQFLSWTKLTMALATGSQHMNVLAPANGASIAAADGAQATPAVTPQSGSTSTSILLASSDAAKFAAGSIVAVDVDYTRADGFCGLPGCGRLCAPGAYGRGLHPAGDVQRGAGLAGCVRPDLTLADAIARRRAGHRRQAAGGYGIRGPRGRQLLSGVVGAVCDGRQPGRAHLLSLSATADMSGRGRNSRSAQRQKSERTVTGAAQRAVSGAAGHGSAGWRARGLLPEFLAGGECAGVGRSTS